MTSTRIHGGCDGSRLWDSQVNAIIDVKLVDSDTYTYKYKPMTLPLDRWENINKYKHGKHCHDQRKYFSPFVLSVDGMLERESLVVIYQFSQVMAEKREETFCKYRGG